jgi:hypothetical protein
LLENNFSPGAWLENKFSQGAWLENKFSLGAWRENIFYQVLGWKIFFTGCLAGK